MRLKAVPAMLANVATAHPLLVGGGAAILAVGGYRYFQGNSEPVADSGDEMDPFANGLAGYGYGLPMVVPTGGGGGGVVDSISGGVPGGNIGDVTQLALLEFEKVKESHDFELANKSLDAQLAIAATNAQIAFAGIQASIYNTGAQLAQTFMMSGQQFAAGNIGDLTFSFLGTGKPITGKSKKSRKAARQQFANFMTLLNNSTIQNILGVSNNVQPPTGSLSASSYGSMLSSPSGGSTGSTSIASTLSSVSSGSTSGTTSSSSTNTSTASGTGGGGGTGRLGNRLNAF